MKAACELNKFNKNTRTRAQLHGNMRGCRVCNILLVHPRAPSWNAKPNMPDTSKMPIQHCKFKRRSAMTCPMILHHFLQSLVGYSFARFVVDKWALSCTVVPTKRTAWVEWLHALTNLFKSFIFVIRRNAT